MFDSLWPHGLQQARLLCPSPTPRAWSNSCPLSQWCHPTISSSSSPFPPAFNLPQHQSLFQWISSSNQVANVLQFELQHQSFQWLFRTDFLQDGLVWSPCSPRGAQEFSPTSHFKSISSSVLSFMIQLSHPYVSTGKAIALTGWTSVGKLMSLLFNMLSRLVIAFLPRSKRLLISWLHHHL